MSSLQSHLTILYNTARSSPSLPVFKVPHLSDGELVHYAPISYSQFLLDVEESARRWKQSLYLLDVPRRSVVGLWLGGITYGDACLIYGLTRAGYIPQLFSFRLPNPTVVAELLLKAAAKALVYDPSHAGDMTECPVPVFTTADLAAVYVADESLPELFCPSTGEEAAFVFHTSGSTSGSPKLVPCSFNWLDYMVRKARQCVVPHHSDIQDVTVWMGSMCHIGQNFMFLGSLQHAACTVIPTRIDFSGSELVAMVTHAGLTRTNQFASFLSTRLRAARADKKVLAAFQSLDDVLYTGLELPQEEERFAREHGVKLTNLYGSTEAGAMMLASGRLLRPMEGTEYAFAPVDVERESADECPVDAHARLLECVILGSSPDCPDSSLRASDGHYHTGDLFAEVTPGAYVFRGRNDDWIKSENSLRIDTKSIEDNVRATCGDLVAECIVVGTGRPSPVLFVEPSVGIDRAILTKDFMRRIRPFHARRYMHERIVSPECIVVLPVDTLPRTATKGNVRRKMVEEQFRSVLDDIFGRSAI